MMAIRRTGSIPNFAYWSCYFTGTASAFPAGFKGGSGQLRGALMPGCAGITWHTRAAAGNLEDQSPVFMGSEAVWEWAKEEATGNPAWHQVLAELDCRNE